MAKKTKPKDKRNIILQIVTGLILIGYPIYTEFIRPNQENKTSTQKNASVDIASYRDGYSHGKSNLYNEANPYEYWSMVQIANNAGITANYILDYNDSWAQGYRDGYNKKSSKY